MLWILLGIVAWVVVSLGLAVLAGRVIRHGTGPSGRHRPPACGRHRPLVEVGATR